MLYIWNTILHSNKFIWLIKFCGVEGCSSGVWEGEGLDRGGWEGGGSGAVLRS